MSAKLFVYSMSASIRPEEYGKHLFVVQPGMEAIPELTIRADNPEEARETATQAYPLPDHLHWIIEKVHN